MLRLRSLRTATITVVVLSLVSALGLAALQGQMTAPLVRDDGRQRAVDGGALARDGAIHAVALDPESKPQPQTATNPTELHLQLAHSAVFDARALHGTVIKIERPENDSPGLVEPDGAAGMDGDAAPPADPDAQPVESDSQPNPANDLPTSVNPAQLNQTPTSNAPAPAPLTSFAGLDFATWGAGHPPDTNGDVGPSYYIQTINTSIGIYDKSNGNQVAAFTFNSFMSQGAFGNLCDTNNFGDPVVLYDSFEDRWFITDFAFVIDGSGNINAPAYQCFAVSKTGDPVSGGWNFYSIVDPGGLGDYPKFGIWPDGIYMTANMFPYASGGSYLSPHVWAINKAQMYAGLPSVSVVDFAGPSADFTILPANARLQAGTPPTGRPEYFVGTEEFLNAQTVYQFHVDWDKISTSTFSGPVAPLAATCWPNANVANAATTANAADVLAFRAMAQAQYTNIGGAESLWVDHTVQRIESATNTNCNAATGGFAAPRWYQINVTGGTVAANDLQSRTWDPDGTNTSYRYVPSFAVDRAGDMAIGYSKSNSITNPQIKYAGRLAGDPVNTFSQAEQTLIDGTGSQSGNCGASACTRWGDYSAMTLDPDGCTFWMTSEYYATPSSLNFLTRIGSFKYPSCTTVGNGTLSGTVTALVGGAQIAGATVSLGSRTTTTDGSGNYSFTVPAGTYPTETAAKAGFDPGSASSLVVPNGSTLTRNFALSAAAQSGCFTDNTQTTFQRGVPAGCSLTTSPGSVQLLQNVAVDQQNTTVTNHGFLFNSSSWAGQTFTPAVTGPVTEIDLNLFCSSCTGTTPNLTVSIRATSAGLPTGADLASATITGFNSGSGGFFAANFGSPVTLTAGTRYAIILRAVSNPSAGTYAYVCSCTTDSNPYANGQRVTSTTSGSSWLADTTAGGRDLGFKVTVNQGFPSSGTLVSSLKDANPAAGGTPTWTTLTYTATTPANTGVKFQAGASNNSYGPFNYVGPDGTAATFFTTSGASLSQFNGFRYLRYKAILTSTDNTVTPTLTSVVVCFSDGPSSAPTTLIADSATGQFGGTVNLSATLTSNSIPVSGKSVSFTLNGTGVGSASTNGSGVASLSNVSLTGIAVGSYPTGVGASFAGDVSYATSSDSDSLTVQMADQAITVTTHAPASAAFGASFGVAATAPGGAVTFSSSGACSNVGATFTMTSSTGTCSVKYDQAGNANYNAAPQVTESVTAGKADQAITVTTHAPASAAFGASFGVAATAPGGTVTFSSSGACSNVGATFTMTASTGTCSVKYDQAGNANYNAAPQVTESVTAASTVSTTTSVVSSAHPSVFSQSVTFTATVSGGATPTGTVQFKIDGINFGSPVTLDGSGKAVSAATTTLTVGSHSISAVYSGDSGHGTSTGTASQTVTKANVTVSVTSNHNPGKKGTSITFTVTVTFASPATKVPGGKVKLFRNGTQIGLRKALSGGKVVWTITWKAGTGTFNMTARYLGSTTFNAATSPVYSQVITT